MDEYMTILNTESAEIIEKKSKFIANIYHVENVKEADEKIKEIKKKYYDAKHNCVAYRVIESGQLIEKSSDDGEPSGTAGGPMLNILQKNNLCNILIIVTRYFGGILLGTGGLVRAYSEATQKVIESSTIISKVDGIEIELEINYSNLDIFKYYCKNNNIKVTNIKYLDNIILKVEMEKNRKNVFDEEIENKLLNINKILNVRDKYIDKTMQKNK